jgi:very-short-patch-repair endonuclease
MPPLVVQEHKIGRFSADFAVPSVRVVIEVDGIHHLSPDVANKDIRKDVYLASEGWKVYRVDCTGGAEAKSSIGLRIGEIVDDILSSNFQEVRRTYDSPQEISKMASRAQVNAISERLS